MIKAIVFDFDGVIVRNSEFGKDKGWENIFPPEIKTYVTLAKKKYSGGRGSRVDIIRELAPVMKIKSEEIDVWMEQKIREFEDFTSTFTINDGIIPEDRGALEILASKYPLYLNSATPESILPNLVEKLGIAIFFKNFYGQRNPNSKIENLERARSDTGISVEEILFVGDQDTDFQAAQKIGCQFVGIMNDWNKWREGDKTFPLISGAKDLPNFLTIS